MKAEFSEFSYGFALAFEIMNALYPTASGVPFFPSLLEEASLGYDVNFTGAGWPLFLQFKLADYMTRRAKLSSQYGEDLFIESLSIVVGTQINITCSKVWLQLNRKSTM